MQLILETGAGEGGVGKGGEKKEGDKKYLSDFHWDRGAEVSLFFPCVFVVYSPCPTCPGGTSISEMPVAGLGTQGECRPGCFVDMRFRAILKAIREEEYQRWQPIGEHDMPHSGRAAGCF